MSRKKRDIKDYMVLVVIVLFISLIVNVFTSLQNYSSNYKVGRDSYREIENIRAVNENNINILETAIDIGSISNMDLLKLYRNFSDISDSNMNLWSDYIFYEDDSSIFRMKKQIEKNGDIFVDVNTKIEEYLLSILDREMQTKSYKLELDGVILDNFTLMKKLSNDISNYYTSFYENNSLSKIEGEDRIKRVIKKHYWIDILEGINEINYKYINENFYIE